MSFGKNQQNSKNPDGNFSQNSLIEMQKKCFVVAPKLPEWEGVGTPRSNTSEKIDC